MGVELSLLETRRPLDHRKKLEAPLSQPDDNRRKLVRTAAKMFSEKGFDAVSTRDLCSAAGVNVASISYYFGGKEGLYLAVFDEYAKKFAALIQDVVGRHSLEIHTRGEFEKILRDILVTFINIRLGEPEIGVLMQRQFVNVIPGVKESFDREMFPVGERLFEIIAKAQASHVVRADVNARSFWAIFTESIWGYFSMQERETNLWQDAYRLPQDQEKFVDFMMQMYVRGICA
jgi:AcrR family transcriptional regulator